MPILHLVRHGEAAAGYSEHPDPGLSDRGRRQAATIAESLAPAGPLAIITSPMARAQETAAPLADRWSVSPGFEPAISEIPSPGLAPAQRGPWLQAMMAGTWADTTDEVRRWRDGMVAALLAVDRDTVAFSHYVAINAAISVATESETPQCRHVDHCSVTTISNDGGSLRLVESGREGATEVL